MNIHICCPETTARRIERATCPDCGKPTRMLCFFQEWYGWNSTCIRCGRNWDDGEWIPLPFERAARRKSIERAKSRWRRLAGAPPIPPFPDYLSEEQAA